MTIGVNIEDRYDFESPRNLKHSQRPNMSLKLTAHKGVESPLKILMSYFVAASRRDGKAQFGYYNLQPFVRRSLAPGR